MVFNAIFVEIFYIPITTEISSQYEPIVLCFYEQMLITCERLRGI